MTIDTVLWSSTRYRKLRIVFKYIMWYPNCAGTRWRSSTIRNDADSIPSGVNGIFYWLNPSGPGFDSTSNWNEYQEIFMGGKGGQCVRLTTLPPSRANYQKILGASTSWSPRDSFIFTQTAPFIPLVTSPMKIQPKDLFQRFRLRLHTLCAVHGLFKHKTGLQRGWNTFVTKHIRFQTVSLSASSQILRQYFNTDRHWFIPSSLPITFPRCCWHNRPAKGFDVKELVHVHSPKPVLSAVTYQTSTILVILLKWRLTKWVGEYRKTSKHELWSH